MQYVHIAPGVPLSRPSTDKIISDEVLIALIAKGDKRAVQSLFARHSVRVFRFLRRMIDNEATAEDLLNEVFLEIWRKASQFEARSQVATWILAIARYKGLAALRRRSFAQLDDNKSESIEDPTDNPEIAIQKTERSALLQDCLEELSVAHREVVDLVYYHEQSIDEVAHIIGVPAGTVKTRVFYARKRIAELLAERGIDRISF